MSSWVLDASALMALLHREPGMERVSDVIAVGAAISTVNLSEVVAKFADSGMPEIEIRRVLETLRLDVATFGAEDAFAAGLLRLPTRSTGLSFGDRACLALASRVGAPVLTADRAWGTLDLGSDTKITLIR